jgi:Ca2+-binding EF-hand superfamily protein
MRKLTCLIGGIGVVGVLLLVSDAFPQIGGPGGPPGGGPGGGGGRRGGGGGFQPGQIFDFLAKGRATLPISDITFPRLRQAAEQYAKEHGITNGQLTRDQFIAARQAMMGGGPAPGGPGGAAPGGQGPGGFGQRGGRGGFRRPSGPEMLLMVAQGKFRQMDLNNDGFLTPDEIPPAQQQEIFQYDFDGDGKISPEEYLAYTEAKAQGQSRRPSEEMEKKEPEDDGTQRPVVYRAGKLPKELPAWFQQLDTDHDGQISLYEWRMAGKPLQEFAHYDRNDDGFLTAEEVLHVEKLAKSKGNGSAGTQTASASPPQIMMLGPGLSLMTLGPSPNGNSPPGAGKGKMWMRREGPASE